MTCSSAASPVHVNVNARPVQMIANGRRFRTRETRLRSVSTIGCLDVSIHCAYTTLFSFTADGGVDGRMINSSLELCSLLKRTKSPSMFIVVALLSWIIKYPRACSAALSNRRSSCRVTFHSLTTSGHIFDATSAHRWLTAAARGRSPRTPASTSIGLNTSSRSNKWEESTACDGPSAAIGADWTACACEEALLTTSDTPDTLI